MSELKEPFGENITENQILMDIHLFPLHIYIATYVYSAFMYAYIYVYKLKKFNGESGWVPMTLFSKSNINERNRPG